ncbi:MAG TPA: twin-arginine translocase TatA/TatE family subunit [Baekduia sp.]|nr:twin-arginine translocase TatA/TatE family subunit [Baekduia sp.]
MPFGLSELIVVLFIVLLVFGPKRLPMLGRQLGGGMREFKDSISRKDKDGDETDDDESARPELTGGEHAEVLDPTPDVTRAPAGGRDETVTRPGS